MTENRLLLALRDQQAELAHYATLELCHRPEEALIKMNSKKAQVVIGVRRSGKSTLCYSALRKSGVSYGYVNFDDERLCSLKAEDLNDVLLAAYQVYGKFTHLFLDEVQNVDGWHLFVNRLLRQGIKVILTGSNSKLLSSELTTHLTGRYNEIELYPFSFTEYCDIKNVSTRAMTTEELGILRHTFDQYLLQGGFPEIANGDEEPQEYVDTLVDNVLGRDIIDRFKIRYKDAFKKLSNHLMNNAPCEVVYDKLKTLFGFKNGHTVENYVSYLYQAFMLVQLKKYSSKSSERIRNAKSYVIDVALMDSRREAFARNNMGWRLETLVFLELKRRYSKGYDIYYLKDGNSECDFIVCHRAKVIEAIQVSFDIDDAKTRQREINGLLRASAATKCDNLTLVTAYSEGEEAVQGKVIRIEAAYKWLLGERVTP